MKMESRLQSLAETQAILEIPEGREEILAGEDVSVTVLAWPEC